MSLALRLSLASLLLLPAPVAAQTGTEGSVRIEAPAGISVMEDRQMRLLLSQSGVTFIDAGHGYGRLIVAGLIVTGRRRKLPTLPDDADGYALSGVTVSHDMLSVSVAGRPSEPKPIGGDNPHEAFVRVVLAQYN